MAKTIALSDEVYEMLSKAKMKGESFSDAIRRLLERQKIGEIPKILEEDEAKMIKELIKRQKEAEMKKCGSLIPPF
ncbi:MAG: antitoxin VapB family protein [Candidatus Aenigmatarchaeota archaeon]